MLSTDGLRTWAEVDYDAIEHNVREIEKLMGSTKIMGIVKADAYGHGAAAAARALKKPEWITSRSPACRKRWI